MKIDCSKTVDFLREWKRMCVTINECVNCGMRKICDDYNRPADLTNMEHAEEEVQEWSDEHPVKTILEELIEHYPKLTLADGKVPITQGNAICPSSFGFTDSDYCAEEYACEDCWNQPVYNDR